MTATASSTPTTDADHVPPTAAPPGGPRPANRPALTMEPRSAPVTPGAPATAGHADGSGPSQPGESDPPRTSALRRREHLARAGRGSSRGGAPDRPRAFTTTPTPGDRAGHDPRSSTPAPRPATGTPSRRGTGMR
ncbi:hypothetical protein [Streptomyces sp. NPDC093970]|uniref:hypothetical protein n=1 Tax=Streptomyces sp. NPDC093970 TaxID=3155076 RepID=UPI0034168BEF